MTKTTALLIGILAAFITPGHAQTDSLPPTLTAFTVSPSTVNTGSGPATVTVTYTATDDLSGVARMQICYTSPGGAQTACGSDTGAGSVQVVIPRYSAAGTWTPKVTIADAAGNADSPVPPGSSYLLTVSGLTGVPGSLRFSYNGKGDGMGGVIEIPVTANGFWIGGTPSTYTASVSSGAWLSISPSSGSVPAVLTVAVDRTGLSPGTYQGSLTVTAGGATYPVPVTLEVH